MKKEKTELWWKILIGIACFNLCAWTWIYWLWKEVSSPHHYVQKHLLLSGIYTFACAFRSFWPRIDLERYCLVDSFVSSMVLGRTAATLAEISFGFQMMYFLQELSLHAHLPWIASQAIWVVVALTCAQVFCWLSVISLSHWGHFIEESIWGITFLYIGCVIGIAFPYLNGDWFWIGFVGLVSCVIYVAFMGWVDVPMYYQRWQEGKRDGQILLGGVEGFKDAFWRRECTRDWEIWKNEIMWLTGYFAGAVWVSILLVFLPR